MIDEQTVVIRFQDRDYTEVSGRALLHALGAGGAARCGQAAERLTPTGSDWDPAYLPHVPRCPGCLAATGRDGADPAGADRDGADRDGADPAGADSGEPGGGARDGSAPALPAAGVDVRAAHGGESELAGAAALREVLARHDLRRWMFTDLVVVDEQIRGGFSHPLTISPRMLIRGPASALATFLHEQLHWLDCPGLDAATTEARQRWPDPPPPPAGCLDAESTWLHMTICALEYQGVSDLLGPAAAAAELGPRLHYGWVYRQILDDPAWFRDFLDRHDIRVPAGPRVPRRCINVEW
jgi:hypothetical protein